MMRKILGTIFIILGLAVGGFGIYLLLSNISNGVFILLSGVILLLAGLGILIGRRILDVIEDLITGL